MKKLKIILKFEKPKFLGIIYILLFLLLTVFRSSAVAFAIINVSLVITFIAFSIINRFFLREACNINIKSRTIHKFTPFNAVITILWVLTTIFIMFFNSNNLMYIVFPKDNRKVVNIFVVGMISAKSIVGFLATYAFIVVLYVLFIKANSKFISYLSFVSTQDLLITLKYFIYSDNKCIYCFSLEIESEVETFIKLATKEIDDEIYLKTTNLSLIKLKENVPPNFLNFNINL